MKRQINRFFVNMLSYGGISIENGIIFIWADPNLFFPIKAISEFHYGLSKVLGKDWSDFIYWIGKIYGKNSVTMLVKKFGYKPKDLNIFLDGASQDGFGFCSFIVTKNVPKQSLYGEVLIENQGISKQIKELYGLQKEPFDYYLTGICAGGTEAAFDMPFTAKEIKCIAKGDDKCVVQIKELKKEEPSKIFEKLGYTYEEILKISFNLYSKRNHPFKLLTKRDVSFGDGSFTYKNIKGVIFPEHMFIIVDKLLRDYKKVAYLKLLEEMAKFAIGSIESEINKTKLISNAILNLDIFGLGQFRLNQSSKNRYVISNKNSYFPSDYISLFSKQKEPICNYALSLLKYFFEKKLNKTVKVVEKSCRAMGNKECIFEIEA